MPDTPVVSDTPTPDGFGPCVDGDDCDRPECVAERMTDTPTLEPGEHVPTITLTDDRKHYTVRCSCDWGTCRYETPVNDEWKHGFWQHVVAERNETITALRAEVERLTQERDKALSWQSREGLIRRDAEVDVRSLRAEVDLLLLERQEETARAESAEADVARLTRERDEAVDKARVEGAEKRRFQILAETDWRERCAETEAEAERMRRALTEFRDAVSLEFGAPPWPGDDPEDDVDAAWEKATALLARALTEEGTT